MNVWQAVPSVPPEPHQEGSISATVLFNISINYLDATVATVLSKFADELKLGNAVDSPKQQETLED